MKINKQLDEIIRKLEELAIKVESNTRRMVTTNDILDSILVYLKTINYQGFLHQSTPQTPPYEPMKVWCSTDKDENKPWYEMPEMGAVLEADPEEKKFRPAQTALRRNIGNFYLPDGFVFFSDVLREMGFSLSFSSGFAHKFQDVFGYDKVKKIRKDADSKRYWVIDKDVAEYLIAKHSKKMPGRSKLPYWSMRKGFLKYIAEQMLSAKQNQTEQ